MKCTNMGWPNRILVLSCCLALVSLPGCQRPAEDPVPPFTHVDEAHDTRVFLDLYAEDEAEADKLFKGKIVSLDVVGNPWGFLTDAHGEKYVCRMAPDPDKPGQHREVLRCYVYRPDAPVIEHPGEYYGVTGVCKGKIDGVIVLRNCSFSGFGGPDW